MFKALFLVVAFLFCTNALWDPKASMLFPRSDFVTATIGQKVYVMGGCTGDQNNASNCPNITNVLTCYDFVNNNWAALNPAPRARYRYMAAVVGNKIYYIGGRTLDNDAVIAEVDVYDAVSGGWSTLPSQNGVTSISDAAAFVIGTKIYVSGGYTQDYTCLNSTIVLDTAASPQVFVAGSVAAKTMAAGDNGAVAIGGFGYVFGGFSSDFCTPLDTLERYDPTTNKWTTLPKMTKGRGDMAYAVIDDNIFIMGGESKAPGCVASVPVGDVNRYSVSKGAWFEVSSSLAINRFRFSGAAYQKTIYDIGGQKAVDTNGIFGVLANVYALDVSSFVSSTTTTSGSTVNVVCSLGLLVVALLAALF